jgi:uncharacterized damage-inducible protein DinB
MGAVPREARELIALLAEAPRRIAAAVAGKPEARLKRRTQAEPWSVSDILAHLRAGADVREKFIRTMLTQDKPVLRYVSPRSYIKKTDYLDLPFAESFQAYRLQRQGLLKMLQDLPPGGWARSTTIKERPETVLSYAGYLCDHETLHCAQIEALLK